MNESSPDQPLVSVVVPACCVVEYLRECAESIFTQSYRNLEVIIVDDGSPALRSTPLVREDLSLMRALASRMREPARRLMATRQPLAYRILLGAVLVSARLADVSYWAVARRVGGGS